MKLNKLSTIGMSIIPVFLLTPLVVTSCSSSNNVKSNEISYKWLKNITKEIPNRVATLENNEEKASKWIIQKLELLGYKNINLIKNQRIENELPINESTCSKVQINQNKIAYYNAIHIDQQNNDLNFNGFFDTKYYWKNKDQKYNSQNIMLNILSSKENAKDVFLVSHYDTANNKNDGTNDNSSGLAVNLAIAEYFSNSNNLSKLNVNIHILFASAEEQGVIGTNVFVDRFIKSNQRIKDKTLWMINLDSVAGGDILYVHSPDTTASQVEWNTDSQIRDQINQISKNKLIIHPQIDPNGFKKGETGDWSDHAPFYKNGIKVAYIESTNFNIKGKDGFDGYSQTINPYYWKKANGSIVRLEKQTKEIDGQNINLYIPSNYSNLINDKTFTSWGRLWHMDDDVLDKYEENFPGRLQEQMKIVFDTLIKFIESQK